MIVRLKIEDGLEVELDACYPNQMSAIDVRIGIYDTLREAVENKAKDPYAVERAVKQLIFAQRLV